MKATKIGPLRLYLLLLPLHSSVSLPRTAMPSILELGAPDRKNGQLTATGDSNALSALLKDQISHFPPGKQYNIAISEVPVTVERLSYYPKEGDRLQDAGTARANIAASNESPDGTSQDNWAQDHKHQTVCPVLLRLPHITSHY